MYLLRQESIRLRYGSVCISVQQNSEYSICHLIGIIATRSESGAREERALHSNKSRVSFGFIASRDEC